MHPIDGENHLNNKFVSGDPTQNKAGTKITAEWLNMLQDELSNVLIQAGINPNKASNNQVITAILALFPLKNHNHSYNSLTGKPSIPSTATVNSLVTRVNQLEALTTSNDLDLDSIQEIVAYIKKNAQDIANAAPQWSVIKNKPDLMTRAEVIALIEQQALTWG